MEYNHFSESQVAPFKKAPASRRVWTRPEEEVLILGLKDLIEKGWKSDNAFRQGYLRELEAYMRKHFPTTTINGTKHITSKITVWKKTYGQVSGMQHTSGFGFNEQKNMITCNDDVWENYVRVHPDVENMRFKSFPYYKDWEEVFGKDRATGDDAQNLNDAVLELLHPHLDDASAANGGPHFGVKGKRALGDISKDIGIEEQDNTEQPDGDTASVTQGDNEKSREKKKDKKKRKQGEAAMSEPMMNMLGQFLDRNNQAIESIAARIAARQEAAATTIDKDTLVFQTVSQIGGLPQDMKIFAAFRINELQKNDLFLGMDSECQCTFVQMLLEGKFGK